MVAVLDERHVAAGDLGGRRVAHAVGQLAGDLLVGDGVLGRLRGVAGGLFGGVRGDAALGAVLGLYPRGAIRDVEVLLSVVRRAGHVVGHAERHGDFVLHVGVACGYSVPVSIEQGVEVHLFERRVPPLVRLREQEAADRRQRHVTADGCVRLSLHVWNSKQMRGTRRITDWAEDSATASGSAGGTARRRDADAAGPRRGGQAGVFVRRGCRAGVQHAWARSRVVGGGLFRREVVRRRAKGHSSDGRATALRRGRSQR